MLDGDAKPLDAKWGETGSKFGKSLTPLYPPGLVPEEWAWSMLGQHSQEYAEIIGLKDKDLQELIQHQDRLFDNATDKPATKIKNKFYACCDRLKRSHTELMRTIARRETQRNRLEIKTFVDEFEMQLRQWQARG